MIKRKTNGRPHSRRRAIILCALSGVGVSIIILVAVAAIRVGSRGSADDVELSRRLARIQYPDTRIDQLLDLAASHAGLSLIADLEHRLGRVPTNEDLVWMHGAIVETLKETYPSEMWVDAMAAAYSKHLDANDLRDIVAFYESAPGRKFLQTAENVAGDQQNAFREVVGSRRPQMLERFHQRVEARLAGRDTPMP